MGGQMQNQSPFEIIRMFQSDATVQEIHVRGNHCIHLVRATGPDVIHPSPFPASQSAAEWIQEYVWSQNQRLDVQSPEAGAVDGHWRWHTVIAPMSGGEAVIMFRRQQFEQLGLGDFADPHGLLFAALQHVKEQKPMLIAGPTGSGKTSLLVAMLKLHYMSHRLFFLESIREIPALSPCWAFLLIDQRNPHHCLNTALRLSPSRFVLGEVREGDFSLFVRSCLTGHGGTLATYHGSHISQIKKRLGPELYELDRPEDLGVLILTRKHGRPMVADFTTCLCDQRSCG